MCKLLTAADQFSIPFVSFPRRKDGINNTIIEKRRLFSASTGKAIER